MPILQQTPPQQAPVAGPPQQGPGDWRSVLAEHGFTPVPTPRRTLLTSLIEENLQQQYDQENKPLFSGFMRDVISTAKGTAEDLMSLFFEGPQKYGAQLGFDLVRQDLMRTEQGAQERLQNEYNPSLIDLTVTTFGKGFVAGTDFGVKNLPVIGDYFHAKLDPVNEVLEQGAHAEIARSLNAMNSKFGQAALVEVPALAMGLGGTLTGGYLTLKPWLAAGNIALAGATRLRGAASFAEALKGVGSNLTAVQSGFLGDIAGASIFGFVTGERGFISGAAEGPVEAKYGQRLWEMNVDSTDPWWKQSIAHTVNRSEAAAAMGVDTFLLSALFATGFGAMGHMGTYATAKMNAMRTSLLGGEPIDAAKIMAMRQQRILTEPGTRQFAVLRNAGEANAYVDLLAQDELISASPGARRILAEQASVEGIVSYHTQVAALAKAVDELHVSGEATHGVLRRVNDPYRMLREVREANSPPLEARVGTRSQGPQRPIMHTPEEIPEAALYGYTEGWTRDPLTNHVRSVDRNVPVFLKNRPKGPAVERGNVEEVIVVPGKPWEFDSWNAVMEKYGSVDDMIRAARKNNVDVVNVNNTGAEGGVQHIILDPASIKSARPVTPNAVGNIMAENANADRILAEMGEEPLEVALKRRMPEYRFETPIKREDGTYDLIFAPEGAPGLSNKQLKQFKDTGFFSGQRVMYGGKTWEVVRRRGKTGQGRSIEIKDPTTGSVKSVSVGNVFEYPSAVVPAEIDDALYRDWLGYFDEKLRLVGERQPDEKTLRNIAMATDDPARLNRDFVDRGLNAIIHPHEMMAEIDIADALAARVKEIDMKLQQIGMDFNQAAEIQSLVQERVALQGEVQAAAKRAQAEGALSGEIDLDKAFVDFPDEMDYGTVVFQDWSRARGIDLSPGEAQALKHTFYRRMNEEVFAQLPEDLRADYQAIQDELVAAWEKLPDTLETQAAMAGFEVMRLRNNTIVLRRPGSLYYEGMFSSEEAAQAALRSSLRYGGVPNMTPQYNWLDVALPSGPGMSPVAGVAASDMHYLLGEDARNFLNRTEDWNSGKWLTGKPAWLTKFEDISKIPLWTEHVEPLFVGTTRATNEQTPFMSGWIENFVGLNLDDRLKIRDFIRTVESHSEYLDIDKMIERARSFGLDSTQIKALRGMRTSMDEMFQIGTRMYGWTPNDYIFSYLTKMWPREQAYMRGDLAPSPARRYAGLIPEELDVFMSKYARDGMLPIEEEDPLVIGMKYIRTFFHEAHVRRPYERLAGFLNTKLKDLPPEVANSIVSEMQPTVRRQLERAAGGNILNADAFPHTVKQPLKEMLEYIRGVPNEAGDLAIRLIRGIGRPLGMKMDERTASEIVNSLMLGTYGATLAFRPKPVVRNMFQVVGNLASRTSFAAVDVGMSRATNPEAFARAVDDGIIDLTARGLPFGQEMTIQALESGPIEKSGAAGWFFGGLTRATMLDGTVARTWRRFAEKGLVGIGRTDMYTRVAAAETADVFVRPWAQKYADGAINEAKLVRKALPYWETPIRNKFVQLIDEDGLEAGMSYIRRETSNIANYIYAKPAQPTALQKPIGRMAFQFGIWPIWRKDLMVRSLRNSRSLQERMAYVTREAMVWGALSLAGARLGINMVPWMAHESVLSYSGGPLIQVAVDINNLLSQRDYNQRVASFRRLINDNVIRMFPVGRIFGEDVVDSIRYGKDDPMRGFLHMFFGRPVDDDLSWSERMMYLMDQYNREQAAQGAQSGGESGFAPSALPPLIPTPQGAFPPQPQLNGL